MSSEFVRVDFHHPSNYEVKHRTLLHHAYPTTDRLLVRNSSINRSCTASCPVALGEQKEPDCITASRECPSGGRRTLYEAVETGAWAGRDRSWECVDMGTYSCKHMVRVGAYAFIKGAASAVDSTANNLVKRPGPWGHGKRSLTTLCCYPLFSPDVLVCVDSVCGRIAQRQSGEAGTYVERRSVPWVGSGTWVKGADRPGSSV